MHDEVWGCAEILPLPLSPNITLLIFSLLFAMQFFECSFREFGFGSIFFPCWCFSLFFSLACLVDCKEKFCLGHSWELSNYWFFFRFLVALFPVSRLIKVWYEEPFLFIITSMNVRVPTLLLSQLIEYIVTKLFLSQDDYILFPYEPLVYWVRTDQMEWLCATLS